MPLEDHLLTESLNPASEGLDALSSAQIVELMNAEDARAVEAVGAESAAIARAIDEVADRFRRGGRLIYVGAGTSGRLGVLDASECPPTFNSPPNMVVGLIAGGQTALTRAVEGAEDDRERGREEIRSLDVGERDLVVGIATSGRTPYVLGAVEQAKVLGAFTVGLACNRPSLLGEIVNLEIAPLVGPEVLAGSTRLKAGTATKLVLNMLTTGAMVRIGKTMGNRMIDLQPTNEKLRIRTRRILREVAGIEDSEARDLLDRCEGNLKRALVSALVGVEPDRRGRLAGTARRPGPARGRRGDRGGDSMTDLLLLGVNGGGTSTTAWLADAEGRLLGRGVAGPSNIKAIGADAAREGLDRSIRSAFENAGLEVGPVEVSCLGLAGFDRPEDKRWLEGWAEGSPWARRLVLVNDGDLVVAAGTPEGWGVGVIAGTGSIAVGRSRDGRSSRAGGWGYLFGDEGSGYAVALAGLRKVAHYQDGRYGRVLAGADPLSVRLCEALGIASTAELVSAIYREGVDRAKIASLATAVVAAAEEDSSIAPEILEPAGVELARMVAAAARRIEIDSGTLPLALAGSFLLNASRVSKVLVHRLIEMGFEVQATPVPEPVEGALVLARRMLNR